MKHATRRHSPPGLSVSHVRSALPDVPTRRAGRLLDWLNRLTRKRYNATSKRAALVPLDEQSSSRQDHINYPGDCRCYLDPDGNCELERLQHAGLDPACLPLPYLVPGSDSVPTEPEVTVIRRVVKLTVR